MANTGGSLVNSSTLLVPVYKGLNAVRITASGAGMKLRSATFTYVSSFGDFNGDGHENFIDFAIFANAWKSQQGQANWNAACDIASPKDNIIDWKDLSVFAGDWLKGY